MGIVGEASKRLSSIRGANYFFLGGIWGLAAIPCLCPACLAGPAAVIGRGVIEKVDVLRKLIG